MLAITVTAPMPLTHAAVSAFAARGTGTEFWDVAGLPASNLPQDWVMSTEDLVDAALAGLDRGEFTTVPSLQDASERDAWEAAREIMLPRPSSAMPAARYCASKS